MEWYEKGIEDIYLAPTLTVDDTAYDTSNFTEITVKVFHATTHEVIGTYTLTGGTVTRIAPTTSGQISFIVPSETTATSKRGKYFYQIHTTENEAGFPGGVRERSYQGLCFGLKQSV